jgi:hypothetical protein
MKKRERTRKVKRSRCYCYSLCMAILSSSSSRFAFRGLCANAFTGNIGRVGVRSSLMSSLGITDPFDNDNDSNKHNKETKPPTLILPSHPDFPISSVMAPMVAASDYPFRLFLREYVSTTDFFNVFFSVNIILIQNKLIYYFYPSSYHLIHLIHPSVEFN